MRRDENLLAAVNAGAERDKQILAALNRDDSFKKNVKNIADTLEKKLQHGAARRDKRKNLKDFEIKPDYVEPDPFARGGQAVVKLGEYAAETVCIKCINMVGVSAEIKIIRRVRAESSRRPPRHRRDTCSMAWRCRFLTAQRGQHGRIIVEK